MDVNRDNQQLIADAVLKAQCSHRDARSDHAAELSTIETELTQTDQPIDRCLGAFERGALGGTVKRISALSHFRW